MLPFFQGRGERKLREKTKILIRVKGTSKIDTTSAGSEKGGKNWGDKGILMFRKETLDLVGLWRGGWAFGLA